MKTTLKIPKEIEAAKSSPTALGSYKREGWRGDVFYSASSGMHQLDCGRELLYYLAIVHPL